MIVARFAILSVISAGLIGCSEGPDYDQGAPASSETGFSLPTNIVTPKPVLSPADPGVAPEPSTQPVVPPPTATPAVPEKNPAENLVPPREGQPVPPESSTPTQNEQGTQVSPEPKTGDDANPDTVNPRP